MSTPQEYWDACLIRTWRKAGNVWDVMELFHKVTGKKVEEVYPPLLRTPAFGFPWKVGVRVFVASHLSKISKRLWDQPPEKDVAMLHKLKDSKYDTEKDVIADNALNTEIKQYKVNKTRQEFTTRATSNRNQATDWNVNKGPRR